MSEPGSDNSCPSDTPIASCEPRCGSLLCERIAWERANPRPEALVRAERAIVRGLAAEFGKGQQHQVTRMDGFDIAVDDVIVRVTLNPDAS